MGFGLIGERGCLQIRRRIRLREYDFTLLAVGTGSIGGTRRRKADQAKSDHEPPNGSDHETGCQVGNGRESIQSAARLRITDAGRISTLCVLDHWLSNSTGNVLVRPLAAFYNQLGNIDAECF